MSGSVGTRVSFISLVCIVAAAVACLPCVRAVPNGTLPSGPLNVAYYETWSDAAVASATQMDLALIPEYVNVVILSFLQPDCTYTKGQTTWQGTGFLFSNPPSIVRGAIALLKAGRPNTRVLASVGGSAYTNWVGLSTACIQAVVSDLDLDGVDLDYEPANIACTTSGGAVSCNTDAQSVAVAAALRAALPRPSYLMGAATWHIGMYGEGNFTNSKPGPWSMTGINLAMAKSPAGQALDFVSIMAYIVGDLSTTGYDYREAYRAHRVWWPSQGIAIGSMVPPEDWGGHAITLPEVVQRCTYARDNAGAAHYGHMLWSMHLNTGCPGPKDILQTVCSTYNMSKCNASLPYYTIPCNGSTLLPQTCTGASSGQCGSANGQCCLAGYCCSQYGWCGNSVDHCGTGCQQWASGMACSGTGGTSPSPSPVPPSPSPKSPSPSPSSKNKASPSPSPSPKPSPSPSPAPKLSCTKVSTNGACGPSNGNTCCPSGQCCSFYGYCGTTRQHCYRGCQASYSTCWPADPKCSVFNADGTCGGASKACCPSDLCCSSAAYCGSTTAHCYITKGCQVGLGNCTSA